MAFSIVDPFTGFVLVTKAFNGVNYCVSPEKYVVKKPTWPRPTWAEIAKM